MSKKRSRSMIQNKCNTKKLTALAKVLQGYMTDDTFCSLYLRVAMQGGVIQDIRLIPVDKKDITKVD